MNTGLSGKSYASLGNQLALSLTLTIVFAISSKSQILHAADFEGNLNSVSISEAIGENSPPIAQFTFTNDGDVFSFDASSSSDPDGEIVKYIWDFGDGTEASEKVTTHTYSVDGEKRVTLTVLDNNGDISIVQKTLSTSTPVNIAINFQPATSPVPAGFLVDSGQSFSDQTGYGWTVSPGTIGTRDRNSTYSPSQEYDTFIHILPTGTWEHKVPNGNYTVSVAMGDPSYFDTTHALQIEGQSIIPPTLLNSDLRWLEKSTNVNVQDQRLTLQFSGATVAKMCWITISNSQQ